MLDERWAGVQRVLAVRLDNLGDVLVTSPALHALKENLPHARLTLLASPVGAQAGNLHPDIDDVIVYEAPWMDPWHTLPQDLEREARILAEVREGRFDAAIIFTSFRQSPLPAAYLCYLAGIPLRHAASIDGPGSLLTTRHRHPDELMHEVERGLDLVGALGMHTSETDLVLQVPVESREAATRFVADVRRTDGSLVVVHPGCSMPARTYPWELYADVADLLADRLDATVMLTGSRGERELTDRIASRMRTEPVNVAGSLDFPALCGLVECADLTVTNNTGPMHVSAAVKTPVVALFALTNIPEQWGPWHVKQRMLFQDVPCHICYSRVCPYAQECLRGVTPSMVVDAAAELLSAAVEPAPALVGSRGAA